MDSKPLLFFILRMREFWEAQVRLHLSIKGIKEVLYKLKGCNVVNFAKYIDELIDNNKIKCIFSFLYKYEKREMNDIKYRLSKF